MNLFEFQGKELFARYKIPIPKGKIATTPDDAFGICNSTDYPVVVKAQVLTGGRGKAGGIKVVKNSEEAKDAIDKIFGMDIKGHKVNRILVEEGLKIDKELYLSMMLNRNSEKFTLISSFAGGMDIEETAKNDPDAVLKLDIDPIRGFRSFHMAKFLEFLKISDENILYQIRFIVKQIFQMMNELFAELIEINPLVITEGGRVIALDSKVVIDDNGLPFLEDFKRYINHDDKSENEIAAKEANLSYVSLDGDIGCVVNGAGLAMATMDMIKHFGGEPANFLDVGGSSNPDKVINALKIITKNPVKVILFNIFGGITRCDDIANGIKEALNREKFNIPIVVRLTGTNEKEGIEILDKIGIETTTSMQEAVKRSVSLSKEA